MSVNRRWNYYVIVFLSFIFCFGIIPKELSALTEILPNEEPCTIIIRLNKEFYAKTSLSIAQWINRLERAISRLKEDLNHATTQKERDRIQARIALLNEWAGELTEIIMQNPPMTTADVEALTVRWQREIEDKWNIPNYKYKCCKVKVKVRILVRDEVNQPTTGFDQIGVVRGDFRSFIRGSTEAGVDSNGFSITPYLKDLEGVWESNSIDDYEAPHEAGHEMGLDDQFENLSDGRTRVKEGHEHDLMGGKDDLTDEEMGDLQVISTKPSGEVIDNLKIVLDGMNAPCDTRCCEQASVSVGFAIDSGTGRRRETSDSSCPSHARSSEAQDSSTFATRVQFDITKLAKAGKTAARSQPVQPIAGTQYKRFKSGEVTCDTGVLCKDTPQGMDIYAAALASGKSVNFRNWKVSDMALDLDGNNIKPVKRENFYVEKESLLREPESEIFAAINSQCEDKKDSGTVGIVSGITGRKCTFKLDEEQAKKIAEEKGKIKIVVENEELNQKKTIEVPVER